MWRSCWFFLPCFIKFTFIFMLFFLHLILTCTFTTIIIITKIIFFRTPWAVGKVRDMFFFLLISLLPLLHWSYRFSQRPAYCYEPRNSLYNITYFILYYNILCIMCAHKHAVGRYILQQRYTCIFSIPNMSLPDSLQSFLQILIYYFLLFTSVLYDVMCYK